MEKFIIQGNNKLKGEIKVNGAKNFALKILPAAFLSDQPLTVTNVPEIEDIKRLLEIIEDCGAKVERLSKGKYKITPPKRPKTDLSKDLVPQLRASILLVGPLLARYKKVDLPHPGGCIIGKRPIDQFIKAFESLGAKVRCTKTKYIFEAPQGLTGGEIIFSKISVTGTESAILAASLAKGTTTITNAACEPEVLALAEYLNTQGAKIKGAGTPTIEITGVKKLKAGKCKVIPDRIEAGSFILMAAATDSKVKVSNCNPDHLTVPLKIIQDMGVKLEVGKNYVEVLSAKNLKPDNIATHEYPGFPTDLQAPMAVLLTQAQGTSEVHETIFENRFMYVDMLNRMGADIKIDNPREITINGPVELKGKELESPDIRAGIALVIAALMAKGESEINNIYQIDRGYENIAQRLQKIGAKIKRV